MLTRIQHFAIVSENFVREAKFYESAFGMKRSKPGSEEEAEGDTHQLRGQYQRRLRRCYHDRQETRVYPGFASFWRRCGRRRRGDRAHQKNYPDVAVLKRPSNRPFATYGAHDPEGNYFDLTQEGMSNRRDVYAVRPSSPQVEASETCPSSSSCA